MNNKTSSHRTHRWLTPDQRTEVRSLLQGGVRAEELAVRFDVHFNTIRNIGREEAPGVEVGGNDRSDRTYKTDRSYAGRPAFGLGLEASGGDRKESSGSEALGGEPDALVAQTSLFASSDLPTIGFVEGPGVLAGCLRRKGRSSR